MGDDLVNAAKTAESMCLIPVLTLIKDTTGADFSSEYGVDLCTDSGCIELKKKDSPTIKVRLSIVDKSYDFLTSLSTCSDFYNVKEMSDMDDETCSMIIEVVSHLCRSALFVFNNIRNSQTMLGDLHLQMSDNTTLFISSTDEVNLGCVFFTAV